MKGNNYFFVDLCSELDIEVYEHVAHTLWDPMDIIASNGGTPPLTYEMFVVTCQNTTIK